MSHAADRSSGKNRKMLLTDVKKSPMNSKSADAVFIELSEEVGCSARPGDQAQVLALWIPTSGGGVRGALREQTGWESVSRGEWRSSVFLPR